MVSDVHPGWGREKSLTFFYSAVLTNHSTLDQVAEGLPPRRTGKHSIKCWTRKHFLTAGNPPPPLSPQWLTELLEEFSDVSCGSVSLRTCRPLGADVEHHMKTTGTAVHPLTLLPSLMRRNWRISCSWRKTVSWSSPLHVVKKADGSWQRCGGHFRHGDCLSPTPTCFRTCTIFSKIYLRKGYHQISRAPSRYFRKRR